MAFIPYTPEEFIEKFRTAQPALFNQVKLLENYTNKRTHILVETKYGICSVCPNNLIDGYYPSILSAINKNDYFIKQLESINPKFFINNELIGKYIKNNRNILIKNKYGICSVSPRNLLAGYTPSIKSAINKNEYFINQVTEIHGDKYDYSKSIYTQSKNKIEIICKKHGSFSQRINSHLNGDGCYLCGKENATTYQQTNPTGFSDSTWIEKGNKSKDFESFKLYTIKCSNDDEVFYKIGKTFKKIKTRFAGLKAMPYKYEILNIIESNGKDICILERNKHKELKNSKYFPKIPFPGQHECFSNY